MNKKLYKKINSIPHFTFLSFRKLLENVVLENVRKNVELLLRRVD